MRTLAIVNQKGGCGKTTTAVNLAGCLARDGAQVLVLDMDPQAHATLALGVDPETVDANLYEVLVDADDLGRLPSVIRNVGERLDLAPSGIVLSALEQRLALERSDDRTLRPVTIATYQMLTHRPSKNHPMKNLEIFDERRRSGHGDEFRRDPRLLQLADAADRRLHGDARALFPFIRIGVVVVTIVGVYANDLERP